MTRREVDAFVGMTSRSGVSYQPGLDGIRGLAVAAVVAFHSGLGFLPGGYLGVSLFFTLSGVVIGTVIIHEVRATRRFSLRQFWSRRARRLLPAAWIVLAFVAVGRLVTSLLSATTAEDVAASWLNVANWHFLAEQASYRELFTGPSALLHFWSLAIEEQFYLAIGLVAVGVAGVSKRPAHMLGVVAGLVAVVSFALPIAFGFSVDRTYYGTDTRAGELAVGLVLAAVLSSRERRQRLVARSRPVAMIGLVAMAATVVAWLTFENGTGALRVGLLPATALASVAVTLAALVPRGPVWQISRLRPLRALGGISYGLYLVHWPVFVILETLISRTWVRAPVGIAISLAIAILSARIVELPVRRRTLALAPTMAAATVVAVVIVTTLVLPAQRTRADEFLDDLTEAAPAVVDDAVAAADTDEEPDRASVPTSEPGAPRRPTTTGASGPAPLLDTTTSYAATPPRPRVGIFGDSIAVSLALALRHEDPIEAFDFRPGVGDIGCGALLSPYPTAGVPCDTSLARWAGAVTEHQIQVPVVMSCQWELVRQMLPGDTVARAPGDPVFDAYLIAAMTNLVDVLRNAGAEEILWVRCPHMSTTVGIEHLDAGLLESRLPERIDRWNQLIDDLDLARDDVRVLDLATWVDARVDDTAVRPDGEHYEYTNDTGVAAELVRLVDEAT